MTGLQGEAQCLVDYVSVDPCWGRKFQKQVSAESNFSRLKWSNRFHNIPTKCSIKQSRVPFRRKCSIENTHKWRKCSQKVFASVGANDQPTRPPRLLTTLVGKLVLQESEKPSSFHEPNSNFSSSPLTSVAVTVSRSIRLFEQINTGRWLSGAFGDGSRPWLPFTMLASNPMTSM